MKYKPTAAILLTGFTLCITASAELLTDFKTPDKKLSWFTVNDSVMGGISKGGSYITEANQLLFKGKISLKNRGGFSSIRTSGKKFNLSNDKGYEVTLKGDGRKYYFTSRHKGKRMLAFWQPIQTKKDEWITVKLPFESFYATSFGRKIRGLKLDTKKISSIGFMLYDKKDGRFSLQVKSIKTY